MSAFDSPSTFFHAAYYFDFALASLGNESPQLTNAKRVLELSGAALLPKQPN
jgi:hypothetical protein